MVILNCIVWLTLVGIMGFLLGRLLPDKWMTPQKWPFGCFSFEKNGQIYEKLGIRKWQKRLPDMSRILPFMMPAKNLKGAYKERLEVMIRETCVAETVHIICCICGLHCLRIWPGIGGILICAIYTLLNLPFILIQRYNRPRLIRLQQRLEKKLQSEEKAYAYCNLA